jgi:hypothetical protein
MAISEDRLIEEVIEAERRWVQAHREWKIDLS